MKQNCLACDIINGKRKIPGGIIYKTDLWSIEPCIGPFPVGTLILKPIRHVLNFSNLIDKELSEFSHLLKMVTDVVLELTNCDQTYICQWSHAKWEPVHIHFVIQPAWNKQKDTFKLPGPYLQYELFKSQNYPTENEIEEFAIKAKQLILERL